MYAENPQAEKKEDPSSSEDPPVEQWTEWEELMENCWDDDPDRRPQFTMIVEKLSEILQSCQL